MTNVNDFEHCVRLTNPGTKEFAEQIADRINKDYPDQAKAVMNKKGFVCMITEKYSSYCKDYVLSKCKIKEEVREK